MIPAVSTFYSFRTTTYIYVIILLSRQIDLLEFCSNIKTMFAPIKLIVCHQFHLSSPIEHTVGAQR